MKKLVFCLMAVTALMAGCSKDNGNDTAIDYYNGSSFLGTMTVTYQSTDYKTDNVQVDMSINKAKDGSNTTLMTLVMKQIKFVPQMPVVIDITIPGLTTESGTDGTTTITGNNIIPEAMGGQYPLYKITNFTGTLDTNGVLNYSMTVGSYPVIYKGNITK